jgi:2-dehydropantoate 2-reductase
MGCLFAYLLSKAEGDLWLIDNHLERKTKIEQEGLCIEGISGEHHLWPKITLDPGEVGPVDLVLLCVKAGDSFTAAKSAYPLLASGTSFLTLQNGLGNIEKIEEALGKGVVLGGTTAMGATALASNRIRHAGWGETVIGETSGQETPRLKKVLALFEACGIQASLTGDLEGLLWSKLVINVGINALTALTRLRNGELVNYPGTRRIMRLAVEEACAVVRAKGIRLLHENPIEKVESVCHATASNISSMLQDVLRTKRTEVGSINGAVMAEGERLGIPTPVNAVLMDLVMTIQESYATRIPG